MSMPADTVPAAPAASPPARPVGLIVLVGLLAVALLGSLAFAGWAGLRRTGPTAASGAAGMPAYADDALGAARSAAERVFSYDYRSFDNDVKRGLEVCTGEFADDYRETTGELRATVDKERVVVRARVSEAGVVKADPKRVEVLLFLNQYRRSTSITAEKVEENRVVLVMVPGSKDAWLVTEAIAL